MQYADLREFLTALESRGELKRITAEVNPRLEITEICDRALRAGGPALLFENPAGFPGRPVLANLFGTTGRVALGMGQDDLGALRELGKLLAYLRQPDPPKGLRDAWDKMPVLKQVLNMAPKTVSSPPCQSRIVRGGDVDLNTLPIQTCWPEDAAPLITWPLVVTKGPSKERERQNLGIYRMQLLARNKLIMRWLPQRGGAQDFRDWKRERPGENFPVAVALGADPATMLAAVTPIPDNISEHAFAGLLRGGKTELAKCLTAPCAEHGLHIPARAEYILEGFIAPDETALEGPFGDHTGYYNEADTFPVFTVDAISSRIDPIYHSTYTGRPPDEPSVLGAALNEVFIPLLQKQFPEIVDFHLPPEACSYRLAVITIRKQYPGHASRVMLGAWSFLRQFMYTKFIIVTDDDIDARNWHDVIWAITTRMDPKRDTTILENTPIDYLDFASPVSGLGSKIGFDATAKWPVETPRPWGRPIAMAPAVKSRIDAIWKDLGIFD